MNYIDFDWIAETVGPEQFARAIGAEKMGTSWRCPRSDRHSNGDRNPSFSIDRHDGRTVAFCHGCGLQGSPVQVAAEVWGVVPDRAAEELVRRTGLSPVAVSGGNGKGDLGKIQETYSYVDKEGHQLFQVVRFAGKQFRQRRLEAGEWKWSTKGVRRVLYRLPEVLSAVEDGSVVWIVEGEKDADRLAEEGLVGTTSPGGAGKWRRSYTETLAGADVVIVPDNDSQGREHAQTVAHDLHEAGCEVCVLKLPELPEKGDVSDFLDDTGSIEDLKRLATETEPWEPDRTEPDAESDLTRTDSGNSARLVEIHGDRLHYIPEWGKWIVEEDGFWFLDHKDIRVREMAKDVGRRLKFQAAREPDKDRAEQEFKWGLKSLSANRISSMVNLARGIDGIPLDYRKLDADAWLLGVENGVVELKTGRLREADPSDLITLRCPVPYDPEAHAPRWERAMREWFPDPELRDYVQRVAGAALVGGQMDHTLIIHYGTGRNGKGTFVRALQHVLGDYAAVVHHSLLVQQKHSEHDTVKAELFRKRLAVASETERRVKLREASVKNLTGGDRIIARRMREDPWEFDPTHSIWVQTNHLPEIDGRDRGIWSRIRVVKWESVFEGTDADPHLDEKLEDEAAGILRFLVEGCLAWQEHGLDEPEAVIRKTLEYRESEDTLARFKRDTGLTFSPELEIRAGELQELLTDWAHEEGLDPSTPRQDIGKWLRENGCQKTQPRVKVDGKVKRPRVWVGIGIPDAGHEREQTDALV